MTIDATLTQDGWVVQPINAGVLSAVKDPQTNTIGLINPAGGPPIAFPVGGGVPKRHKKPGLQRLAFFDKAANVGGGSAANCADVALDRFYPFTGNTSVVFTVPSASTFRFSQAAVLSTPLDMTNGQIHISMIPSVNASIAATPTAMVLELYSAGTPASPGTKFISADIRAELLAKISTPGCFGCFSISVAEINTLNGGAVLTDKQAVLFAMLRVTYAAGSIGGQMALGAIDYVPNASTTAPVLLCFDDGYLASNLVAKSIMDKAGLVGVLYADPLSNSFTGTQTIPRMTTADIDRFVAAGWQMASQRYSIEGDNAAMSNEVWLEYQKANLNMRRSMGWPGGEDGSWYGGAANPFNNGNTDTLIAKRRYAQRLYRTIRGYYFNPLSVTETWPFGDPMAVRSCGFNAFGNSSAANVGANTMGCLTKAGASKGAVVFTLHGELDNAFNNNQALTDANIAAFQAIVDTVVANPGTYKNVTMMDLAPS
ncbi:hypothetical protein [Herbaspirillum rubrisubalbicans]|uniref:Uncharacterized protein n=1 Tax=Herbaspirillum rubrisubalbicans TaxID=80842 RepID=A0AAD0U9U3_9BURK|nr:hypothetical protein [Herbaspirillum rubrisubalbicans]AYR23019.1 hypothetical protein RC54_03935 [Herbaspirillum rubrisubalbicans]